MKKIAIIGAGISGLYLANLLEKDSNYDYTIYEKKSEIYLDNGFGIQLSQNSVQLLNKIGFRNILPKDVFFPLKVNFFNAKNNKKICDIDISRFNKDNIHYTTLKRSSLIEFLLNNISSQKIKKNIEIKKIDYGNKIKIIFSDDTEGEFDHLIASDGVFSKTKSLVLQKNISPKFLNAIALRGSFKNLNDNDISLFLGSNFHFVIYPVNQKREYNFISVIHKKLNDEQLKDHSLFHDSNFLKSLKNEIGKKTFLKIEENLENIKSFPIYVSKDIHLPYKKNIYFVGDALFAYPPSFAQGASQSIESSYELFGTLKNEKKNYYKRRLKRLRLVYFRSKLNYFAFQLSNPLLVFFRNIFLKFFFKNNKFLEIYLGRIYRN